MSIENAFMLFASGVLAGGLNALAGGGGFITLPALMYTGLTPVQANINGTLSVWPGLLASLFAYRRSLTGRRHPLKLLVTLACCGGLVGAALLLVSTNTFFLALLPWLLLFATLLFIWGPRLTARLVLLRGGDGLARPFPARLGYLLIFTIAIYGGYFGGGMGIMTLAVLSLIGMEDIHEMNALKTFLVVVINGVAVLIFIAAGQVAWTRCLVMSLGCVVGGYCAVRVIRSRSQRWVRGLITVIASGMTLYFFLRSP